MSLLMISATGILCAQYKFRHIDVTDGLSDNQVKSLNIAPDGQLSIRTTSLVNFFNGSTFSYVRHDEQSASMWPYSGINKDYFDSENRMWIKERNHLYLLDLTTYKFVYDWQHIFKDIGIPGKLRNFFIDKDKSYWCVTEDNDVFCYDVANRKLIKLLDKQSDQIRIHGVPCEISQDGNLHWIIYEDGFIQCWNLKKEQVVRQDGHFQNVINDQSDRIELCVDKGNLWVMYNRGISFFDVQKNNWTDLDIPLSDWDLLTSMERDKHGNLWVGSSKSGLRIIHPRTFSITHIPQLTLESGETISNDIHTIKSDSSGGMWIGTFNQGILYYHSGMHRFSQLPALLFPSAKSLNVRCMFEEKSGTILLGTLDGLLRYDPLKNVMTIPYPELSHELCLTVYKDSRGRTWVGTFMNGLFCIDGNSVRHYNYKNMSPRSDPNYNNVRAFCEDDKGNMWISVFGGLGRFDPASGNISLLREKYPKLSPYKIVTSLIWNSDGSITAAADNGLYYYYPASEKLWITGEDANPGSPFRHTNRKYNAVVNGLDSMVWYGTQDGLNVVNLKTNSLRTYYQSDGLPSNVIQGLIEDSDGKMWITTPNGISCAVADGEKITFTNYTAANGLPKGEYYENSAIKAHDGTIYFGGVNGVTRMNPMPDMHGFGKYKAVFTGLKIFNMPIEAGIEYGGHKILDKSINYIDEIHLSHDENFITLEFSGLNFVDPSHTYYRYKLEGLEKDWTIVNSENGLGKVTYTGLAPGKYVLKVYASDNPNTWSHECRELKITVAPPFWASTGAFILYAVLILAAAFDIFKWLSFRNREMIKRQQHEELDQMKFRFFTNVSHELRTPLTLIITPLDAILKKLEDGRLKKQLSSVYRNSEELLKLVNQLLDFRKLEMKGEKLNLGYGDFVEFLETAFNSFHGIAEEKHIQLDWNPLVDSVYMYFDKDKVHKIINNLLANALKFTPEGGNVSMTVSKLEDTDGRPMVSFSISDTGIGISKKDIEHIFDRFYQAVGQKGEEKPVGSGIGLHLIKEYTNLHQGRVSVSSKLGSGTVFTVLLPRDLVSEDKAESKDTSFAAESDNSSPEAINPLSDTTRPTILIVEDNEEFRRFMSEQLCYYYNVIEAADGCQGEEKALECSPDLIVSDIMMPNIDGLELLRRLKSNIQVSHIPVILLTARSSDETRISGYESGADEYISKPFKFDLLLTRIQKLIEQQKDRKQIFRKTIEVNPSEITITSLDEKLIQKALECVEKNMDNSEYSVENLSSDVGMSRMSLYRKLQSITGQTPSEFIRSIRLKRAAQLLCGSQLSIAEIANKVGFSTPKYFTKYFKEMFGTTPSQYSSKKDDEA